jgi:hypothetical protein
VAVSLRLNIPFEIIKIIAVSRAASISSDALLGEQFEAFKFHPCTVLLSLNVKFPNCVEP